MNKMKKIYFIGLIMTLGFIGIRLGVLHDSLSFKFVAIEVLLALVFAHLYLGVSYSGMMITRNIFKDGFAELKMIGFWLSSIGFALVMAFYYVSKIQMDNTFYAVFSGFSMFIIGCVLEHYQEDTIEFRIDENTEEIKDEDFKIKL